MNRNVTAGSKYDEKQDLARAPMQIGEIDSPVKQPRVLFAHIAPKQCNMRCITKKPGRGRNSGRGEILDEVRRRGGQGRLEDSRKLCGVN